jgi:hypothetical protein
VKRIARGRGPARLAIARLNPWSKHLVVKDPFAALSIPWFERRGCTVVAIVRHPATVAASYRRLGWHAIGTLDRLAESPRWLDDDDRELLDRHRGDQLESTALLWRVVTRRLAETTGGAGARLITHEAVSADPSSAFAELRELTALPWSRIADHRLHRLTTAHRSTPSTTGPRQHLRRTSGTVFTTTLAGHDQREIDAVWRVAQPIAERWYRPDSVR